MEFQIGTLKGLAADRPAPDRSAYRRMLVFADGLKLYCTILYYTILYYTILYYTIGAPSSPAPTRTAPSGPATTWPGSARGDTGVCEIVGLVITTTYT